MTTSRVVYGPFTGQITALQGTHLDAMLHDGSGARLALSVDLRVDSAAATVTAALHASSPGEAQ
jgi:hypothetical protein